MVSTFLRIAALTLLCCALPTLAVNAWSAPFSIQHDTSYARMVLPSTLGQSTEIEWGLADPFDLVLVLSLDAELDPDGSLGQADYVFGKGHFALELVIRLPDGTLHTMRIGGATDPLYRRDAVLR